MHRGKVSASVTTFSHTDPCVQSAYVWATEAARVGLYAADATIEYRACCSMCSSVQALGPCVALCSEVRDVQRCRVCEIDPGPPVLTCTVAHG